MTFVAEVDATGHIAVTDEMREALHLVPGSRVTVSQADELGAKSHPESETLESDHDHGEVRFAIENGLPVIYGLPPETIEETLASIDLMRRERMAHISGPGYTADDFL